MLKHRTYLYSQKSNGQHDRTLRHELILFQTRYIKDRTSLNTRIPQPLRSSSALADGHLREALVSKLPAQTEIVDLTHNETALRGSVAFSQRMQRRRVVFQSGRVVGPLGW